MSAMRRSTSDQLPVLSMPNLSSCAWVSGMNRRCDSVMGVTPRSRTRVLYRPSSLSCATIDVHSSRSANFGLWYMTRARPMRCCSPPESTSSQRQSCSQPRASRVTR
mmetsp:Transcript_93792/g.249014  ORF Transcript_93792/g.249014 Transcript_93792/m.249014 type:complete len:107 (+) Transcript_93792:45-365(+)